MPPEYPILNAESWKHYTNKINELDISVFFGNSVESHDVFQETVLWADDFMKLTCERMLAEGETWKCLLCFFGAVAWEGTWCVERV